MEKTPNFLLGLDGCKAGWICSHQNQKNEWKFEIFPTIEKFWKRFSNIKLILIDIPIGLRDKGMEPRLCDELARKLLTRKRSSSIFPPPCRTALDADSYIKANFINKKFTGKGLSKQSWNICSKIREVDFILRNNYIARELFIESHPELCFTVLSGNKPMTYYKKSDDGIKERLSVIEFYCKNSEATLKEIINQLSLKNLSIDDILDSWILAIAASKGMGGINFIPINYEYDSEGLPMRMAIPKFGKL